MAVNRWTLIDQSTTGNPPTQQSFSAADLGLPNCSALTQHWHAGQAAGVVGVELNNGKLNATVLPTRGMGIWKCGLPGWEIGWKSPVRGPVHPALVPLTEPSGLGWLDGFDELLCRCGLMSNGAPEHDEKGTLLWPLHGRIANTPAHFVELISDPVRGELTLRGVVDECRFHFQKLRLTTSLTMKPGEAGFTLIDEVTNLSGGPGEMELLYHINLGEPLLDAGANVVAAVKTLAPRNAHSANDLVHWNTFGPADSVKAEQVYFLEPLTDKAGRATVLLKNAAGTRGASVGFSAAQLPVFSLWKNTATSADGYVAGLEPGINFPNPRSAEARHGRVKKLAPGETARFELTLRFYQSAAEIRPVEQEIVALQHSQPPQIFNQARPEWS